MLAVKLYVGPVTPGKDKIRCENPRVYIGLNKELPHKKMQNELFNPPFNQFKLTPSLPQLYLILASFLPLFNLNLTSLCLFRNLEPRFGNTGQFLFFLRGCAEELPRKRPSRLGETPIGPENARCSRADFPLIFSEIWGLSPRF